MNRFKLEKSKDLPDWWVLTDTENLVVVRFKEYEYNETHKVSLLKDDIFRGVSPTEAAAKMAKVMREIADYLVQNHSDLVMPAPSKPVHDFFRDEDDTLLIMREKFPAYAIAIYDENITGNQLAATLKKTAAWLKHNVGDNPLDRYGHE